MTSTENDNATRTTGPSKGVHPWKLILIPLALGLALGFLVTLFQWAQTDAARWFYIGLDGMQSYLILGLSGLMIAGLTIFATRPSLRCIVLLCAGMIGLLLLSFQFVRFESFNGDRTPRFTWRWKPTAEEKVRTYLTSTEKRSGEHSFERYHGEVFAATDHDFPGFMGTDRTPHKTDTNIAQDWDARPPRLLWRHPVGLGWSSFAIIGQAAINLEQRGDLECVVCYNLQTGQELWAHAEEARFQSEHGDGPRSTPTIIDGRVFSCGATGIVTCLDLKSGELIWKRELYRNTDSGPRYFGLTCSPLVVGDQVIVTPGIQPGRSILALDVDSGEEVWESGDDMASYASPMLATLCGQKQFLSFNGEGLRAYGLRGESLWFHPWQTQGDSRVNVAQPVVVQHGEPSPGNKAQVVISSGYEMGTTLLNIGFEDGQWSVETEWTSKQLKAKLSNFVRHRDHLYGLDNGLLTCIRLADGQREWKQGRYGHGQMLLVDNALLIQAESGDVVLVAASPEEFRELARFPALSDKTWNHPALAGNVLVLRNDHEAAAFELPTLTTRETLNN